MSDGQGTSLVDQSVKLPDHESALRTLVDWLAKHGDESDIGAVGHRIVHGGPRLREPQRVTAEVLDEVRRLLPFDPLHLPSEIRAVELATTLFPSVPQVACFDTAFHATIPEVARVLPIPRKLADEGIHRYGFHGLSYEYIVEELTRIDPAAARGDVVVAHLGSGASLAAIHAGKCADTTMGFTPTGGLVMATRCGDLDPGVLLYLLKERGLSADQLGDLVNHESGLAGVSGLNDDVRGLLSREADTPAAKLALDIFCHSARKFIAAMSASLGGLQTLVFTAGIGEHSPSIRARICEGLQFLGVEIDPGANAGGQGILSKPGGKVTVRVIPTNEEQMIARHTRRVAAIA
jgi:acetate kinase